MSSSRIQLNKYQTAELIDEVNGLCPVCLKKLITSGNYSHAAAQAAHIYPHSPSAAEKELLSDVPLLSQDAESMDNLIMLCPTCHWEFDHPRTRDGYMKIYNLKRQIKIHKTAKEHYQANSLEEDVLSIFECIANLDIQADERKLSYHAMTIDAKMSNGASLGIKTIVKQAVRDYYVPIHDSLMLLESTVPGKSDLIAKQISLFYSTLVSKHLNQDDIYYELINWLDARTNNRYKYATPILAAYYIQNCEVFSI